MRALLRSLPFPVGYGSSVKDSLLLTRRILLQSNTRTLGLLEKSLLASRHPRRADQTQAACSAALQGL